MKKTYPSLIRASSLLSSSLNLRKILPEAMKIMEDLMKCEAASIMLLDEEEKNLIFEVALGKKGKAVKKFKLPVGKGIAGKVAQEGKPLIIYDAYRDKRFYKQFDQKSGFKTKSLICVPLKVQNRIIGVAEVLNPIGKKRFTDEDASLLSIFANQVALSIDSARLHTEILEQKRLEDELKLAQSIQKSFLPAQLPQNQNFSLDAMTRPARIIGGDLYDAITVGGKTFLFLGDVSGKGAAAALFMASCMSKIRFICHGATDLSHIMKTVNNNLCEDTTAGLFVTMIAMCIEGKNIYCANAGHPDPILYSAKESRPYLFNMTNKELPLGILKNIEYPCEEVKVNKGDVLLTFSDGVTEAKNRKNEMFSYEPLLRYRGYNKEPAQITQDILGKIDQFKGKSAQSDDITLMTLKMK